MKTYSNVVATIFASILVFGAAGCASDHDRRGVDDSGAVVSDTWITTKVKSDLAVTKDVDATDIGVHTYAGVVTLSGNVDNQAEADKAIRVTNDIKGVKSVVNEMRVK
ncbi:MAG: BON domain-containing protein [Pyrinomonadaceae bacterium]|nr:BON domain-containing protein [Phycisphaerales bacterium]